MRPGKVKLFDDFIFLMLLLKAGAEAVYRISPNEYWLLRAFMPCWNASTLPLFEFTHVIQGEAWSTEKQYIQVFLDANDRAKSKVREIGKSERDWQVNDMPIIQLKSQCEMLVDGLQSGLIYKLIDNPFAFRQGETLGNHVAFQDSENRWLFDETEYDNAFDCAMKCLTKAPYEHWRVQREEPIVIPPYNQ